MNIFVAGHCGMVGSAIVKSLSLNRDVNVITANRKDLDLLNQVDVIDFFKSTKIDQVYLAAAKVGGIHANNKFPGQFIYENLVLQTNVIHSAHCTNVNKLLFLGSSCIYPKLSQQPIKEEYLLQGLLEETNEPYAIAKIAGIKLCESYNRQYGRDYRCVMPTNLYGPNDNFHSENSHVIPAMIQRFHHAVLNKSKQVVIWGSGKPLREFLHVEDMASACIHIANIDKGVYYNHTKPTLSHINVGSGVDCTIRELAETIATVTGFKGQILFDLSKPDGTARKLLDITKIRSLGWQSTIKLADGLRNTYSWYKKNYNKVRLS